MKNLKLKIVPSAKLAKECFLMKNQNTIEHFKPFKPLWVFQAFILWKPWITFAGKSHVKVENMAPTQYNGDKLKIVSIAFKNTNGSSHLYSGSTKKGGGANFGVGANRSSVPRRSSQIFS